MPRTARRRAGDLPEPHRPISSMKIAAFTMAYNERAMLPLWLAHYGAQFGRENLFVIDHGSTDGSTEGLWPTQRFIARRHGYQERRRAAFVSAFHAMLLHQYDVVLFSDVDEMLVARPGRFAGLRDYIEARCETICQAVGLDVLQLQDEEPPLDLSRPVLSQRTCVRFARKYCKPLISRIPVRWRAGCHSIPGVATVTDPDLFMFHLKLADRDLALAARSRWQEARLLLGPGEEGSAPAERSEAEFLAADFSYTRKRIEGRLRPGLDFHRELDLVARGERFQESFGTIPPAFHDAIPAVG